MAGSVAPGRAGRASASPDDPFPGEDEMEPLPDAGVPIEDGGMTDAGIALVSEVDAGLDDAGVEPVPQEHAGNGPSEIPVGCNSMPAGPLPGAIALMSVLLGFRAVRSTGPGPGSCRSTD
jgi:hypothetical protein